MGLPSLLWTIICPHFRALGLDFLVFSRLRFQDFGANETHPIHTHKPTIFIFHKGCPLRAGGDARSVRNLLRYLNLFLSKNLQWQSRNPGPVQDLSETCPGPAQWLIRNFGPVQRLSRKTSLSEPGGFSYNLFSRIYAFPFGLTKFTISIANLSL